MGIDESGQDHLSIKVNDNGVRGDKRFKTFVASDKDDFALGDGDRLGPITLSIDRVYGSVL
jgi:hypothetical protein